MTDDELMLALYDEHKDAESRAAEWKSAAYRINPTAIGAKFGKDRRYVIKLVEKRTRRLYRGVA